GRHARRDGARRIAGRGRGTARRRSAFRRILWREHPGRHEVARVRPGVPGARSHAHGQGDREGAPEGRGPAAARAQGPDPRAREGRVTCGEQARRAPRRTDVGGSRMTPAPPARPAAPRLATDLAKTLNLSDAGKALLNATLTVRQYFDALVGAGHHQDA